MQLAAAALLLVALATAGWWDVAQRRVPNWLAAVTMLAGLGFAVATGGGQQALWHLAHAVLALMAGMGLFALGWWGGGDGKFYAAVAAWFPLQSGYSLLLAIAAAGLVLVVCSFAGRRLAGRKVDRDARALPYAVAISGGAAALTIWPLL